MIKSTFYCINCGEKMKRSYSIIRCYKCHSILNGSKFGFVNNNLYYYYCHVTSVIGCAPIDIKYDVTRIVFNEKIEFEISDDIIILLANNYSSNELLNLFKKLEKLSILQ